MIVWKFVCNFVWLKCSITNKRSIMDKYKYRINFRIEKRKGKTDSDEMPINADITFGGKRVWYYIGYRLQPSKWDSEAQRVKRNNFNAEGVSASDINTRIAKVEVAIHEAFNQLELEGEEVSPAIIKEKVKGILNEEKSSRLTVAEVYQILIDEREKEINETPATAQWSKGTLTKHKTMLRHLKEFRSGVYFEDINDEFLAKFELALIAKGLSNNYTHKSMMDIKTFLNWATKKGYNKNNAYQACQQRFRDETKADSTVNLYALTPEELQSIMIFPTGRKAIDRTRNVFVFACYTGLRFSDVMNLRWSNIDGDILDVISKKTNKRQRFALANEAMMILSRYPKAPDEPDPYIFPRITNQKYNEQLKVVGKLAGMTGDWITEKQSGRTKTREVRPKYELLTSHVARRTFVTMCLRKGMSPEDIRAVTGHTTADMMMKYVKFDDESKREKMSILNENAQSGVETVFDHAITDDERIRLGLPTRETYLEIFEGDTASVNAHLAVLAHIRSNLDARAEYIKRLPTDKLNEVLEIIMRH